MKLILTLAFSFLFHLVNAQNILTVNNTGLAGPNDYETLQAAVSAASAQDIIYVYPSQIYYGAASIDKALIIIGPGHDVHLNTSLGIQTNLGNSKVGLFLLQGSNGSIISGLDISYFEIDGASNCLISKNKLGFCSIEDSNNLEFFGNYFTGIANFLYLNSNNSNISVHHNIFNNNGSSSAYSDLHTNSSSNMGLVVVNNIFRKKVDINDSLLKNNIFLGQDAEVIGTNNAILYNVFTLGDNYGSSTNTINVDESSLFVGWPTQINYSFDSRFQLAPNSPAIGAGENGIDCGVFTASNPYKLSGIPDIPVIYEMTMPSTATTGSGIDVTIKVKTNN